MTGWHAALVAVLIPEVLLTGFVIRLRRRHPNTVSGAAVTVAVAITVDSAVVPLVNIAGVLPPSWLVWVTWTSVAVAAGVGFGYLAVQLRRHRVTLRPSVTEPPDPGVEG